MEEEDANLLTREQYREMLIDASFQDASEMESGFIHVLVRTACPYLAGTRL